MSGCHRRWLPGPSSSGFGPDNPSGYSLGRRRFGKDCLPGSRPASHRFLFGFRHRGDGLAAAGWGAGCFQEIPSPARRQRQIPSSFHWRNWRGNWHRRDPLGPGYKEPRLHPALCSPGYLPYPVGESSAQLHGRSPLGLPGDTRRKPGGYLSDSKRGGWCPLGSLLSEPGDPWVGLTARRGFPAGSRTFVLRAGLGGRRQHDSLLHGRPGKNSAPVRQPGIPDRPT